LADYQLRRNRLRKLLEAVDGAAMLVTNQRNVRYLTGFTGDDSYLLVTADSELLLSDPRFQQQLTEECPGLETWIRSPGEQLWEVTCQQLSKRRLTQLVVESGTMPVDLFDRLDVSSGVDRLHKGTVQVETLREIKDAEEIQCIQRAVDLAQRALQAIMPQLTSPMTELQVANEIDRLIRHLGGSGCSFPPIVAVGPRAALPHATPGSTKIGSSSFVLIDWGATLDGYRSDLTRVLMTSKIPAKFRQVYQNVLEAQRAAIAMIRPGVTTGEVDFAARQVMESAGLADHFNHGTGHGIGLDIHEAPRLAKGQQQVLQAGMVVTVEPGAYFPHWGGVRIEDDVLVTQAGQQVLSSLPVDLESNVIELEEWK
jgi:Xaa-Pro aminopeptidase